MDIQLSELDGTRIMTVQQTIDCRLEDAWELLGTSTGLASWFPELRLVPDGDRFLILFIDGELWHEMPVHFYEPNHKIVFAWERATVGFRLVEVPGGVQLRFREEIPATFGSAPGDAQRDMAGWLAHNERLGQILSGAKPTEIPHLVAKWDAYIQQQVAA